MVIIYGYFKKPKKKGNLYNTKYRPNSSRFSGRPTKPHVTAVPEMLTAEAEALCPVYRLRTGLFEAVSSDR